MKMLTVREVALRLSVSQGAIYKAISSNALQHYRIGTAIRISEDQLQQWLNTIQQESAATHCRQSFRHLGL